MASAGEQAPPDGTDNNNYQTDNVRRQEDTSSTRQGGTRTERLQIQEPQESKEEANGRREVWTLFKNIPWWCWMITVLVLLVVLIVVLVLLLTKSSPGNDTDGCPMTVLMHTTSHLPQTQSGESVTVECVPGATFPGGQSKYAATCNLGTWDLTLSCVRGSPESPEDGCAMTVLIHTTSHLPPTQSGGSVTVECVSEATLPGGQTKYDATCRNGTWDRTISCAFTGCMEAFDKGHRTSDVYRISPDGKAQVEVYCEQQLDGGGWTLIQRRMNGHISFFRNWVDYKAGFGNIMEDFWLGNDNIHMLTSERDQKLKIEMIHPNGTLAYVDYSQFFVENETGEYQLFLSEFSSTPVLNNSLAYHNGSKFTTKDQDNDVAPAGNCAQINYGGWWYGNCQYVNLNGPYNATTIRGIRWSGFTKDTESLTTVRMMIKKA